jgi:magnesium transporter
MLYAYLKQSGKLQEIAPKSPVDGAIWIDLYRPLPEQTQLVAALGVDVPTLADMEEIEISNRLYQENGTDYMTVVIPGFSTTKQPVSGPVCFILSNTRLVTVRHHAPRPFETYPSRADKVAQGCETPERIFMGLLVEIIGRLADLLEGVGRSLDEVTQAVFAAGTEYKSARLLQTTLERIGRESELVARIRLSLLTIERAVSFYGQAHAATKGSEGLRSQVKALSRDISALEVHADFLSARAAQATDATLGMINLLQNGTVRIVSVVAVLFLPPTLIASIYGMNFTYMPELATPWGYPAAVGLMVASAAATYLYFKWKNWL